MFKQIEQIRQQKGILIKDLCIKAGLTVMSYYNYKIYKRSPTLETVRNLCKILDIKRLNIY